MEGTFLWPGKLGTAFSRTPGPAAGGGCVTRVIALCKHLELRFKTVLLGPDTDGAAGALKSRAHNRL